MNSRARQRLLRTLKRSGFSTTTPPDLARVAGDELFEAASLYVLAPLAVGTTVTWLAQATGLSFKNYSYLLLAIWCACLLLLARRLIHGAVLSFKQHDSRVFALFPAICCVGALVALLYNRNQGGDAYYYLANAVYFVAYPDTAMGFDIHFIATNGPRLTSFIWSTSGPCEYMQAALAYLSGSNLLDIHFILAPAVAGFFTVFSLLYLTRIFVTADEAVAFGTCAALLLTFCLFDGTFSIGNTYFARDFLVKIVYLTAVLPLFSGLSIRYLHSGENRYLPLLLITVVAGLGMSASAAVVTAFCGAIFSTTFILIHVMGERESRLQMATTIMKYWLCLSPVFLYLLVYQLYFSAGLGARTLTNDWWPWPFTFLGQLRLLLFFGNATAISYSLLAFVVSFVASLYLLRGLANRILALWVFTSLTLLFNPISGDFLIQKLHLENIFTRLFYLLPFPLTAAVAAGALYERRMLAASRSVRLRVLATALVSVLTSGIAIPYARGDLLFPPRHKLLSEHRPELKEVLRLAGALQPGVLLAPPSVAGLISIHYAQLSNVQLWGNERLWLANQNMMADGERRFAAAEFLEAGDHSKSDEFLDIVREYQPQNIIATRQSYQRNPTTFESLAFEYSKLTWTSTYIILGKRMREPHLSHEPVR